MLDPTPGAAGHVVDHDGTHRHLVVEEVEEGRRLSWRWWSDGDDEVSRVEITLRPADGGTLVRVVEHLLPTTAPQRRAEARAGAAEATATEVAAGLPVTRQAVAKHLGVLREAGPVGAHRAGRETRFSATLGPLADAGRWLARTGSAWDSRLARLQDRANDVDGGAGPV